MVAAVDLRRAGLTSIGLAISGGLLTWASRDALPAGADLAVYLEAARVLIGGGNPYAPEFGSALPVPLPYTYPPVAAMFATVLVALPFGTAYAIWFVASAVAVGVLVSASWRGVFTRVASSRGPLVDGGFALGAGLLIGLTTPVADTLSLGQVSGLLVTGVYFSAVTALTRDRGGVWVGLFAAIKLTPALFIVWFGWIRRWSSLRRAIAALVVATLLGVLVAYEPTWDYFTRLMLDASRVGGRGSYQDVSLAGAVFRLGGPAWISYVLVVLVIIWAFRLADTLVRQGGRGSAELAVCVIGLSSVLATPVSWAHHAIWIVPASGLVLSSQLRLPKWWFWCWAMCLTPFVFRWPLIGDVLGMSWNLYLGTTTALGLVGMMLLIQMASDTRDSSIAARGE